MALWWLCSPESMPSICLVYGLAVAAGGFEMNWPQQPKWNQPRKGARDAARQSRSRSQNSLNAETQRFAARPSRNRTARSVWSAWSLLPLSNRPTPYDTASKLDALQTLRAIRLRLGRAAVTAPRRFLCSRSDRIDTVKRPAAATKETIRASIYEGEYFFRDRS